MKARPYAFSAKVEKLGQWFVVRVPAAVSRAIGKRGHIAVVGTVEGVAVRKSLLPEGGGRHFMSLDAKLRARAEIGAGDRVNVSLGLDDAPLVAMPVPPDLAFALRDVDALGAFSSLTPRFRNYLLSWIDEAVMETTREKRIAKAVEVALARREKALDREAAQQKKALERAAPHKR